jgi:hypothetical protein
VTLAYCLYLRNVERLLWNQKYAYGIYRNLELNPRAKLEKRLGREKPERLTAS